MKMTTLQIMPMKWISLRSQLSLLGLKGRSCPSQIARLRRSTRFTGSCIYLRTKGGVWHLILDWLYSYIDGRKTWLGFRFSDRALKSGYHFNDPAHFTRIEGDGEIDLPYSRLEEGMHSTAGRGVLFIFHLVQYNHPARIGHGTALSGSSIWWGTEWSVLFIFLPCFAVTQSY